MQATIENGILTIEINDNKYSFEAHGEMPRPSMLGWGLSAGGKHWSSREEGVPIEKHTSVQDIAVGSKYVAWYTQEFLPNGVDYKVSKKAKIYLGNLENGESRLVYKGECYGDLVFDGDDLYFNMGNKVAVISLLNDEVTVLFKHSGIKKNGVKLQITPKRIFYIHWTKDKNYIMWYDRETKETVNPHIDSYRYVLLDENTMIFQGLYCAWKLNLVTLKKSRFFNNKQIEDIRKLVCDFFEIPQEYYKEEFYVKFEDSKDGRLYFVCEGRFDIGELDFWKTVQVAAQMELPKYIKAGITCDVNGRYITFPVDRKNIIKKKDDDGDIRRWSAVVEE